MTQIRATDFAKILWRLTQDVDEVTQEDQLVAAFLGFVKKNRAEKQLPEILRAFTAYADKQAGKIPATITSAHELSEEEITTISKTLNILGEIQTEQDPSMLGGLLVRIGNKIFDLRAQTQIASLKAHLTLT